jgi:hypothetical protein
MKDKKEVFEEVKNLITSFTGKNLSDEEESICLHIWEKLSRKQKIDITRTRPDIWAAGVIWSFCRANFKYEEGVTLDLLCSFFNIKKSTVGNKAGGIAKMLKIDFFNPAFTTASIQKHNPLNLLTMTDNGFIVPIDTVNSIGEQLACYRRLRAVHRDLHSKLIKLLPKKALKECGMALGIYRNDTLVFSFESEADVLMDYCIYDYRWDGRNVIERYINQTPLEDGSDERILLEAMLEARYSLFMVEDVVRSRGVQTRDLFRGNRVFIVDVALSETAVKGFILACRIISPGDGGFSMTTGAGLPADRLIVGRIIQEFPERFGKSGGETAPMSPDKTAEFSASIIRILLEGHASSRITYREHNVANTAKTTRKR